MKLLTLVLACSTLALASCGTPAEKQAFKDELKAVGSNILDATEAAAAQTALDEAKAKLAEIKATPLSPDASPLLITARMIAVISADSLVSLAQARVNKMKANAARTSAKQPVPPVTAGIRERERERLRSVLA